MLDLSVIFILYIFIFSLYIEKGRTLHLLKQCSKPVSTGRKRKKYNVAGTLDDYKAAVVAESESILSVNKEDSSKPEFSNVDTLGNITMRAKNNS